MTHFKMFMVAFFIAIFVQSQANPFFLSEYVKIDESPDSEIYKIAKDGGGGIGMVDVIMLVYTDSPLDQIEEVWIYDLNGVIVFSSFGCGGNFCKYDLSLLDSGTYYAIANVDDGYRIERLIEVR